MDKDYFMSNGISPTHQFEPTLQWNCLHSGQSSDSLFNPNWDQFNPFDSSLNSIASSSPQPSFVIGNTNNYSNTSTHLGSSLPLNNHPPLPALSTDPGFAQRAAKFSCFGSRSFNGRTSPLGLNNGEPLPRSAQQLGNGKLPRVSSSPSLKQSGSPLQIKNSGQTRMEIMSTNGKNLSGPVSNSDDSVSEPSGETGSKTPTELNSRKRKTVSRGKTKADEHTRAANGNMRGEGDDSDRAKRCKTVVEGDGAVNMEEAKGNEDDEAEKQAKDQNQKLPEPPKDYIHVRARRGQATDSHSLAERVRREKISERMKLLQDLVPGCNKVTGKALMLDEIINYVQSLQRQVEFLSMKLASVNPSLDFPEENLHPKNICQQNGSLAQPVFPVDDSGSSLPSYQQLHNDIPNGAQSKFSVDSSLYRSLGMQLPPLDGFGEFLNQFPTMCEDDLQCLVQMGFSQNPNKDLRLQSQGFPAPNQTSHMKIEM